MTHSPITLQDLRHRMYLKAKADPAWRFWGLYGHACKKETLRSAYALAEANGGKPGIDGVTFDHIDGAGTDAFLTQVRHELVTGTYEPLRNRRLAIPKDGGNVRMLSIPAVRDRLVQGALKLILEPIFEADFQSGSFGYRPGRSAHAAIHRVATAIVEGKTRVLNLDLRSYFDCIRHHRLLQLIAARIQDDQVMRLLKRILVANGKIGVPQGGVISPLLGNLYLNGVDRMLEGLKEDTKIGRFTALEYARFADDLVILVDGHSRHDQLGQTVSDRVRQELAKLDIEVNEDKTRCVDLRKEGRFEFLGFEFRHIRSHKGSWRPHYTPTAEKQAKVRRKLTDIVKQTQGQSPVDIVRGKINPIIRGWVNYFAIGHSDRCFGQMRAFLENLLWRQALSHEAKYRTRQEQREWMYGTLGLFNDYRTYHYIPSPPPDHPWGRSTAHPGEGRPNTLDQLVRRGRGRNEVPERLSLDPDQSGDMKGLQRGLES